MFKKKINYFSRQFMTFPGLLDLLTHLNFPLRHPFGGGSICLGRNHPQVTGLSAYACCQVGWGGVGLGRGYICLCVMTFLATLHARERLAARGPELHAKVS